MGGPPLGTISMDLAVYSTNAESAVKIRIWEKVVLNIYSDQKALGPLCSGPIVFAKKLYIPHGH